MAKSDAVGLCTSRISVSFEDSQRGVPQGDISQKPKLVQNEAWDIASPINENSKSKFRNPAWKILVN